MTTDLIILVSTAYPFVPGDLDVPLRNGKTRKDEINLGHLMVVLLSHSPTKNS